MDDSTILHYRPDRDGLIGFFDLFDPSIKIGAYLVGSLVLWLTLKRIEQTDEQIRMTETTYKLNNFFKHRDEFVKQFRDNTLFNELNKLVEKDFDSEIFAIYNYYYYSSYKNFEPSLNKIAKDEMGLFIKKIANSKINSEKFNINEISTNELKNLTEGINPIENRLCLALNNRMSPKIRNALSENEEEVDIKIRSDKLVKFIYCNEIYWSGILYQSLLSFDGSTENIWDNYPINFIVFRESLYYSSISFE